MCLCLMSGEVPVSVSDLQLLELCVRLRHARGSGLAAVQRADQVQHR